MGDWQSIDSAPKDGRVILGSWKTADGDWAVFPILWRKSKMYGNLYGWHMINWPDLELQLSVLPTHWQLLAPPPEQSNG